MRAGLLGLLGVWLPVRIETNCCYRKGVQSTAIGEGLGKTRRDAPVSGRADPGRLVACSYLHSVAGACAQELPACSQAPLTLQQFAPHPGVVAAGGRAAKDGRKGSSKLRLPAAGCRGRPSVQGDAAGQWPLRGRLPPQQHGTAFLPAPCSPAPAPLLWLRVSRIKIVLRLDTTVPAARPWQIRYQAAVAVGRSATFTARPALTHCRSHMARPCSSGRAATGWPPKAKAAARRLTSPLMLCLSQLLG